MACAQLDTDLNATGVMVAYFPSKFNGGMQFLAKGNPGLFS